MKTFMCLKGEQVCTDIKDIAELSVTLGISYLSNVNKEKKKILQVALVTRRM